MTKQDAITVLNDVCKLDNASLIQVRLQVPRFGKYQEIDVYHSAKVIRAFISQDLPELMIGDLDIITITSGSHEFDKAISNLNK